MELQNLTSQLETVRLGRCGMTGVSLASNDGCGRDLEQRREGGYADGRYVGGGGIWLPRLCDDCETERRETLERLLKNEDDQKRRVRLRKSGVPQLVVESLKTITPTGKSLEVRNAVDRFLDGTKQPWLFISGPKGVGKTTEAGRAIVLQIEIGRDGAFVGFSDLLLRIRDTYRANSRESEYEILSKYREAPLLVLDDVGSNRSSAHAADSLFNVLDYRYQRAAKTIITSNHAPAKLAAHLAPNDDAVTAERIVDRIREMALWIAIDTTSYRKAAGDADRDFSWADNPKPVSTLPELVV